MTQFFGFLVEKASSAVKSAAALLLALTQLLRVFVGDVGGVGRRQLGAEGFGACGRLSVCAGVCVCVCTFASVCGRVSVFACALEPWGAEGIR